MKKLLLGFVALASLVIGTAMPAQAYPYVGAITCESSTACVVQYNVNSIGNGYYMARRSNGTTWVRLTMVSGWSNAYVAPITCAYSWSCVIDYYDCNIWVDGCYWMAKNASEKWVRLTLVNGS